MAVVRDLIYDVGLHDGSDTAYYLQRGFRVVAIDANPAMIESARKTFQSVPPDRLTLLNVAIAKEAEERTFWISDRSIWSSFDESIAKRNGTHAEAVNVRCEPFAGILERFGIPYYLKIDIEGSDGLCVQGLAGFKDRPRYISWEATYPAGIDQLRAARDLGYTRFKIIRQLDFLPVLGPPYSRAEQLNFLRCRAIRKMRKIAGRWQERSGWSSGPFGEETPGRWLPWHEVARRWRDFHERRVRNNADLLAVWFDFHARR